jgi:hypothetical protein
MTAIPVTHSTLKVIGNCKRHRMHAKVYLRTSNHVHRTDFLTLKRVGLISRWLGVARSIAVLVGRSAQPALESGFVQLAMITVTRRWMSTGLQYGV